MNKKNGVTSALLRCPTASVPDELNLDTIAYLKQLTPKEHQAYEIAKAHLGMSFDLLKCNGFLEWRTKHASSSVNGQG